MVLCTNWNLIDLQNRVKEGCGFCHRIFFFNLTHQLKVELIQVMLKKMLKNLYHSKFHCQIFVYIRFVQIKFPFRNIYKI